MNGTRRSTRATTSTINVKLNEKNEIEYFKVENEMEEEDDEDDDDIIGDPDHIEGDKDDIGADIDGEIEEDEEEEEEEEELISNADGTMSIKIPKKKAKIKVIPLHHICAKCSKVLASSAVSWNEQNVKKLSLINDISVFRRSNVI